MADANPHRIGTIIARKKQPTPATVKIALATEYKSLVSPLTIL
jgi:hypothetical protein